MSDSTPPVLPPAPKRIEIPWYPGGRMKALTFSWDDGTIHDRPLVAFMNEVGLKGTFNLNSGLLGIQDKGFFQRVYADEVASLYAGHEVAVHSVSHPFLERLSNAQIVDEILNDRKALEDLVGYPVRGMAYPFGTYDQRIISILRDLGIVYSRTVENMENPMLAPEPLALPTTSHWQSVTPKPLVERFLDWQKDGWGRGLYYIWGHSYEFPEHKDWAGLERVFRPMAGHDNVWYATNIQVFDYEEARKRMIISANKRIAYNPSALAVTISVDGKLVDVAGGQTVRLDALPQ